MSEQPQGYCPAFGNYPKEYNRAIHGPYYPHVNYGPKDTPLGEVKLGELKSWLARRNKSPYAVGASISRTGFLWARNWRDTKYGPASKGLLQLALFVSALNMLVSYGVYRNHRNHKYHW